MVIKLYIKGFYAAETLISSCIHIYMKRHNYIRHIINVLEYRNYRLPHVIYIIHSCLTYNSVTSDSTLKAGLNLCKMLSICNNVSPAHKNTVCKVK